MATESSHFDEDPINAYVSVGPINWPKPGPTFARALAEAEKAVIRSEPRSVRSKPKIINDAMLLSEAGVFAIVIECVEESLAKII